MKEILQETAEKLNLPYSLVENVINIYMGYIRYRVSKVIYRNLTTFKGVKTNILLVGLGKLVVKNKAKRKAYEKRVKEITN